MAPSLETPLLTRVTCRFLVPLPIDPRPTVQTRPGNRPGRMDGLRELRMAAHLVPAAPDAYDMAPIRIANGSRVQGNLRAL